jgi:beta-glucosidase
LLVLSNFYRANPYREMKPMKSIFIKVFGLSLLVGLLQACATQSVSKTDKPVFVQWNSAGHLALTLTEDSDSRKLDWDKGIWQLELDVSVFDRTGLEFVVFCGEGCERRLPVDKPVAAMLGQGWRTLNLPLSCFEREGDDFNQQPVRFGLFASGTGKLELRHKGFVSGVEPSLACPDFANLAVTPDTLNTWWARDWWLPRHEAKKQEALENKNIRLVMIGDSITQGWENEGKASWETYFAPRGAINLGFGGDRTENVLWRLHHGALDNLKPRLVVLKIGTNNTGHRMDKAEDTARGIRLVLDEIRARAPQAKILLLGIFPRDAEPDSAMRVRNSEINSIISGFADNQWIFYEDLGGIFLDEQGVLSREVMPDLLHLNAGSYETWAKELDALIQKLF